MKKKFVIYSIKSVEELIPNFKDEGYKVKRLNRRNKDIYIFSKKSFDKYCEDNDTRIVGSIRKRQVRYKDYKNRDELVKNKKKKKIIGKAVLPIPANRDYKNYDIKSVKNCHTYGYAWVGDNKFLQVKTLNPLLLLIPVIFALIIALLFSSCPKGDNPFKIADGTQINDKESLTDKYQSDLCYYVPFSETVTLTKDQQTIKLCNVKENEGKYYISYEIYIDGELQNLIAKDDVLYITSQAENSVTSTGAIIPDEQILVNLWEFLPKGTYELVCKGTEYDYKTKEEKLITYNLTTTLVVEK